jgi:hypothetical protein
VLIFSQRLNGLLRHLHEVDLALERRGGVTEMASVLKRKFIRIFGQKGREERVHANSRARIFRH